MAMTLFTIGDSISQGFMSGAAARTDLSYSTFLARALGLADYRFPLWPKGGHPFNLEDILRMLERRYGANIRGLEWATVLPRVNTLLDEAEDYYERGAGAEDQPDPSGAEFFHNVSVRGFDIADSWLVTGQLSREQIRVANRRSRGDQFLHGPNASFYRTALTVLNPSRATEYNAFTQLDWLAHHVAHGGGVENLLLWLGANNALGTILDLDVRQTPNDPNFRPVDLDHLARVENRWNLWHPDDFALEYRRLLDEVDRRMRGNPEGVDWHVFVGTVPMVTIAPLAKGVGEQFKINGLVYFKYYTYVPFEEEFARRTGVHLTTDEAVHIDRCIREFNVLIKQAVADKNRTHARPRYHVVDMAQALTDLAWKRNEGNPPYQFPPEFEFLFPKVNTKYYHADADGRLRQGGIFSLDGVHPSVIGQGLIAHEFLKVMKETRPGRFDDVRLDWNAIFQGDTLYQRPISLMQEIYQHQDLAAFLVKAIRALSSKRPPPRSEIAGDRAFP